VTAGRTPPPRASVIVPACNEAATIAGLLEEIALIDPAIEIVVVCNGCDDGTETISAGYAPRVRTLVQAVPGKAAALNRGLAETCGAVAVLLDADVTISARDLERLIDLAAASPAADVVQPQLAYATRHASVLVRAYLRVWQRNPYFATKVGGVYALTPRGMRRLGGFPALRADDEYVRRRLFPGIVWTRAVTATVYPPATAWALIRTRSRSLAGAREVIQRHGAGDAAALAPFRPIFLRLLLRRPLDGAAYAAVAAGARLYAALRRGRQQEWARDDTSRQASVRGSLPNA
jgi:glycosyltransferase involved in cell wall biosynthesis